MKVSLNDPPDPLHSRIIEVDMPEGYRRVWRGQVCPGDLYLNHRKSLKGEISWEPIDIDHLNENPEFYHNAEEFTCLIRKGTEVDHPCERCQVNYKIGKNRFCWSCCHIVAKGIGESGSNF